MKDQNDIKTGELQLHDEQLRKPVGRPRVYASAAERQRAYRQRLKESGKRVVQRVMRDVRDASAPLVSDIIDLSEVRPAWRW